MGIEATRQSRRIKSTSSACWIRSRSKSDHKLGRARSSTLRLSPVFRFRRRRCLPLHVAGSVGSTALQRLYVVDDVPRTSAQGLARRGTRMLPLKPADHSARTLDVPVLVPQARCAPAGRSHGAAVLRHQGPTPQNQKQQEGGFPHRQSASNAIFNVRVARPPPTSFCLIQPFC